MVSHNPACLCPHKMGEMKLIEKIDTQTHPDWAYAAHPEEPLADEKRVECNLPSGAASLLVPHQCGALS